MAFYTTYLDNMETDSTDNSPSTSLDTPVLHIYVDEENGAYTELIKKYEVKVNQHNQMIQNNLYPDSVLICWSHQNQVVLSWQILKKVDYKVVAMMKQRGKTLPFYVYARSSIR